MIVHVKGVQFVNQGAHLMLLAVLQRLRDRLPQALIALDVNPWSPPQALASVGALRRISLRKRFLDLNALEGALPRRVAALWRSRGLVAEGDVDAVLDASGFAYGDTWSPWALRYAAGELRRLGRRGRPYAFLPQAFGPFRRHPAAGGEFGAALAAAIGAGRALAFARDETSRAHLAALSPGLAGRIRLCPDFTLGVRGDPGAAGRLGIGRHVALLVPNERMLAASPGYVDLMAALAAEARAQGFEPRVLNHEGRGDAPVCRAIAAAAGLDGPIEPGDPLAAKGIVGAAGLVVASRFHACANALGQGVPCLGTSWSHKYAALFADFGAGEWLLEEQGTGGAEAPRARAIACLRELVARRESVSADLAHRRPALQARIDAMWDAVLGLLAR